MTLLHRKKIQKFPLSLGGKQKVKKFFEFFSFLN